LERKGVLAQLRETLDRVRAHSTDDPEFRRLVLKTIEDYAGELRTMAPPNPRSGTRAEPARVGHPIIVELAKLWDERGTIEPEERVRRFQQILDRFHRAKSLDSFELNKSACQWVNQIAAKNDIKLMLNGTVAVRLRCAPRGKGYFAPLRAKRGGPPVKKAGSKEFPSLTALPI